MKKTVKLLFLVSLFILAYKTHLVFSSQLTLFSDDAIYMILARNFLEGGGLPELLHLTWPPFFPFVSALLYKLIPSWETAPRIVSAMSTSWLTLPVYILARHSLGNILSFLLAIIVCLFTPFVYLGIFPLSDSLFTFLIISSLACFAIYEKTKNLKFILLQSLFLGLAYLTRPEGLLFFSISFTVIFLYLAKEIVTRKRSFLQLPIILASVIAIFFLTISPYLVFAKNSLGYWSLSAKFSTQIQQSHAFALNKGTTWSQEVVSVKNPNYQSTFFTGGKEHLLEHSEYFVWWFAEKFNKWRHLFNSYYPNWASFLILFGLASSLTKRFSFTHVNIFLLLTAAIPVTIFSTSITDIRYLLWTIPLFTYLLSLGLVTLFETLEKVLKTKRVHPMLELTVFIFAVLNLPLFSLSILIAPNSYTEKFSRLHFRPQIVKAASVIREDSNKETPKIMMRHEGIEFYARGETIYFPQTDLTTLITYAKAHEVDYLVAWYGELAGDEKLQDLFDPQKVEKDLQRVYQTSTPEGELIVYTLK